jgi:hypothetical protein
MRMATSQQKQKPSCNIKSKLIDGEATNEGCYYDGRPGSLFPQRVFVEYPEKLNQISRSR